MSKFIVLAIAVLTLSACGCMLEEGDSTAAGDYWRGCWAEAKGNPKGE
ncbi:MAG: hypothetical protein AB7L92_01490 [Alphaproteobacteria bacterium]